MYMSEAQLAAFDRAFAPRAVASALHPPAAPPPRPPPASAAAAPLPGGGLQRLRHGAFGRTALGVRRGGDRGVHPISHQVDQLHGHLARQNLEELCRSTGFTRAQLLGFWLQYKSLCSLSASPLGVDFGAFRQFVPSVALEDDLFVARVFAVLDRAGSTLISWPDFLEAMSCLGAGDRTKRATFLFAAYDREGRGRLSPEDLCLFFASSLGVAVPEGCDPMQALASAEAGVEAGCSPLECQAGPAAKLLACAIFSQKAFALLDPGRQGFVTLEGVLHYLNECALEREVGAVFGRSMLTSLESETKDIMSGAHTAQKDARAGRRITLIKAHRVLMEEALGETSSGRE
jgi:Ca2+-binding EF-hand superfamily protein